MSAPLLLLLLSLPCPRTEPTTTSATRSIDLGETGLLRTHLAIAVLPWASPSLIHRLRDAGFEASPRSPWRLYYRALPSEDAVRIVRGLGTPAASSPVEPGFEDHLDALLHGDRLAGEGARAPTEPSSVPIVLARVGARPPGLSAALDAWLGPEPAFRPGRTARPRRSPRLRVELFDEPRAEAAEIGLVFTSTTELGLDAVEAVAGALGDGPLGKLGRSLQPYLSEASVTSLRIDDASGSAFSLRLRAQISELSDLVRALAELIRSVESGGLSEKEWSTAIRRARGWRSLQAVTPRGRLETRLLDHLRFGGPRPPSELGCLTSPELERAARALVSVSGLRLLVEGDLPPAFAAELARQWPKAEIVLHRAPGAASVAPERPH